MVGEAAREGRGTLLNSEASFSSASSAASSSLSSSSLGFGFESAGLAAIDANDRAERDSVTWVCKQV